MVIQYTHRTGELQRDPQPIAAAWPTAYAPSTLPMASAPPWRVCERNEVWSLSARLERLYETVRPPSTGQPYTLRATVRSIRERFGPEYVPSTSYLADLVRGRRENPPAKVLWALAEFFGVPL